MIDALLQNDAAILQLQAPSANALTLALLDELTAAVRRAATDARIRTIVITGGPQRFSVGADLSLFEGIRSGDDALRISRLFQEAFQAIEDTPKPVVAAVAGPVVGGALELAMACHYRVAAEGSRFSMPEVGLGINPGAGGTQRLPRLIGLDMALEMLLTARPIDARQALDLGLIEAVVAGQLLEAAADPALSAGGPHRTGRRTDKLGDAAAAFAKAEKLVAAGRPELIAPGKIVEAVRAGVDESLAAGLAREQSVFRECVASRPTQNRIYIACARRQTARLPELATAVAPIAKGGVLGMGTMGAGIAQALVAAGLPVVACDQSESALQSSVQRIQSSVRRRAEQGKLSAIAAEAALDRLTPTGDAQRLADADVVVEAVFEDVEVKRAALRRLEEVCQPTALLATNTSTINLDVLAEGMRHPERLVGLHFFHPAQQMPLVEVVRRAATPPEVSARAVGLVKAIGKTPVLVQNREGFAVNRLFIPYFMEAFWLLEEGVPSADVDRALVEFGFPMGPLQLIDLSGIDILVKTCAILRRAFPQHGGLSSIADDLVAAGHLGQKTGAGVYRYEPGDRTPRPHAATEQAIAAAIARRAAPPGGLTSEAIADRLMLRMVVEAFGLLEEKVVERPADLDVAMVLATGLPDFRGGVLRWATDRGLARVCAELHDLAAEHGPRYAPGRMLEAAAKNPDLIA